MKPLPRSTQTPDQIRARIADAKRGRQNTRALERRLVIAVAKQIRMEIRTERMK